MKNNMKNTTELGRFGEKIACDYLEKLKFKIVEQNYYASHNEIDIIAENKQYIIFVEVKTRSCSIHDNFDFGTPASAVTYSKQKRTLLAAQAYLNEHLTKKTPRLDVIEVFLDKRDNNVLKINHIEDAFGN
jgi:putative endonuclease